jgi:hypothetical protein
MALIEMETIEETIAALIVRIIMIEIHFLNVFFFVSYLEYT